MAQKLVPYQGSDIEPLPPPPPHTHTHTHPLATRQAPRDLLKWKPVTSPVSASPWLVCQELVECSCMAPQESKGGEFRNFNDISHHYENLITWAYVVTFSWSVLQPDAILDPRMPEICPKAKLLEFSGRRPPLQWELIPRPPGQTDHTACVAHALNMMVALVFYLFIFVS